MPHKIRVENGEVLPYRAWPSEPPGEGSRLVVAVGWGGVLFPSYSLDERVVDRDTYMHLSPRVGDLWAMAMAMAMPKGTTMRKSRNPDPVSIIGSQSFSLQKENIGKDRNRVQLPALAEEYQLIFEE